LFKRAREDYQEFTRYKLDQVLVWKSPVGVRQTTNSNRNKREKKDKKTQKIVFRGYINVSPFTDFSLFAWKSRK